MASRPSCTLPSNRRTWPLRHEIQEQLRQAYYGAARLNALQFRELDRVLDRLAEAGIPTLALKGAALASTVYEDVAPRPMVDLDILVPRDQVPQVPEALAPLGYQAQPGPPGHSFAYEARYSGEINLHRTSPMGNLMLDVHWHLTTHKWLHHATRIDMEALWQAALPLSLDGQDTLQLCPEDSLLHLCLHWGFGHAYAHLLNLTDIDRTVDAYPGLNWDQLLERASAFQVRVPVYFGLCFSRELLGTPIPDRVLAALQPGALRRRWVRRLVAPQWARSARDAQQYGRVRYQLHLALIDGLAGWLRFGRFLLLPGDEWLAYRYALDTPGAVRLARFWHPFRVLATELGARFRRR